MTNLKLARVGDRIEHGRDIPANVVLLRDQDGDLWRRGGKGQFGCLTDHTETALVDGSGWWPVKVVEVDPEPQPAAPGEDRAARHALNAPLTEAFNQLATEPPGPLVLTLPEVPAEAVALIDRNGDRWARSGRTTTLGISIWTSETAGSRSYPALLAHRGPVAVELAPPREPRTWTEHVMPPVVIGTYGPPGAVEVKSWGVFRHGADGLYATDDAPTRRAKLSQLRALGEVREVLDA